MRRLRISQGCGLELARMIQKRATHSPNGFACIRSNGDSTFVPVNFDPNRDRRMQISAQFLEVILNAANVDLEMEDLLLQVGNTGTSEADVDDCDLYIAATVKNHLVEYAWARMVIDGCRRDVIVKCDEPNELPTLIIEPPIDCASGSSDDDHAIRLCDILNVRT